MKNKRKLQSGGYTPSPDTYIKGYMQTLNPDTIRKNMEAFYESNKIYKFIPRFLRTDPVESNWYVLKGNKLSNSKNIKEAIKKWNPEIQGAAIKQILGQHGYDIDQKEGMDIYGDTIEAKYKLLKPGYETYKQETLIPELESINSPLLDRFPGDVLEKLFNDVADSKTENKRSNNKHV